MAHSSRPSPTCRPAPGNILSVTVGGITAGYTVASGDSLGSAAIGLASALTAQENSTGVQACRMGDRLLLQSQNVAMPGSQIPLQAGAAIGSAAALTSFATSAQPAFLDSTAYGYHLVQAANNPIVGDWLQMTFTKTNGAQVTVAVTNTQSGASIVHFPPGPDASNQCQSRPPNRRRRERFGPARMDYGSYGFLVNAASPGWPASQIQTVFTGSADLGVTPAATAALDDNAGDLQPRAHVYLSSGAASLPVNFVP